MTAHLRYRPDVEVEQPDEAEDIAAVRESFSRTTAAAFDKHRHAIRAAHCEPACITSTNAGLP
ncbi:MAG: hypothetical protein ACRDZ2_09910 [Ilumatobacteraceae bacterium]